MITTLKEKFVLKPLRERDGGGNNIKPFLENIKTM